MIVCIVVVLSIAVGTKTELNINCDICMKFSTNSKQLSNEQYFAQFQNHREMIH